MRVDGQDLGRAAEVGERVVDHGDVDRADRTEVLGDDEVGVQTREGTLVEVVEILACVHRRRHEGVDGRCVESLGHRAGRDDGALAGLDGVVALEGDADDVVARADVEEDLGGRRKQGDDPHEPIVPNAPSR